MPLQIILAIILGFGGLCLVVLLNRLGNAMQEQEQYRERFVILVAQELQRLDAEIKHNNRMIAKAESMLEPESKWWGRN